MPERSGREYHGRLDPEPRQRLLDDERALVGRDPDDDARHAAGQELDRARFVGPCQLAPPEREHALAIVEQVLRRDVRGHDQRPRRPPPGAAAVDSRTSSVGVIRMPSPV